MRILLFSLIAIISVVAYEPLGLHEGENVPDGEIFLAPSTVTVADSTQSDTSRDVSRDVS